MEEYPPMCMRMCPVSPALLLKGLGDSDNVLENKGNIVKLMKVICLQESMSIYQRLGGEVLFKQQ